MLRKSGLAGLVRRIRCLQGSDCMGGGQFILIPSVLSSKQQLFLQFKFTDRFRLLAMKFQVVHYKDEQECSCHAGVYKPLSCSTSLAVSVVCLCAQNERMRKSNLKSNSYRQPLYLISNCRCNFEPPGMGYQCILLRKSTKNRIQSVYSQLSNTLGARQSSRLIREEVAYGKNKKKLSPMVD